MNPAPTQKPRATLVMTVRERHGLTEHALNSVLHNTAQPYRLIYADVQSPTWLRARLAAYSQQWGFEVVRYDEHLWPQQVRKKLIGLIDTEYVVYLDNDVAVEPGWLTRLIACADETGAGVVGPLYLWGDGKTKPKIHMAGGKLTRTTSDAGTVLAEAHHLINVDPETVRDELVRRPCDFAEYHCMLVRAELVRDGVLQDENIYCVREHIDTALSASQRGYPVYLEPSSRVHYLAYAEYMLDDLPIFRARWCAADGEASINAFATKWQVVNDDRSFGGIRKFLDGHVKRVDPVRDHASTNPDRMTPMPRTELQQTRSGLFDQALACGYLPHEIAILVKVYQTAQAWVDGGYRPCGRPFINHLIGVASVLLRYDFRVETVAAGMLHAVYSHCPAHAAGPQAALAAACAALGGEGKPVEKRVRAYTQRYARWTNLQAQSDPFFGLTVLDAEIIAIAAANEIDVRMSGEFRYSGAAYAINPQLAQLVSHVSHILGVNGLYQSLLAAEHLQMANPVETVTGLHHSYRIGRNGEGLVRMASNAKHLLEPRNRS